DTTEHPHRTPLIVSAPDYRDGTRPLPSRVLEHELAHSVDLLPTIRAYAEMTYWPSDRPEDEYAISRNLKDRIENATAPRRRKLVFGEQARKDRGNTGDFRTFPRYVVTRPGVLGVCQNPYEYTDPGTGEVRKHVHPCLDDLHCPTTPVSTGHCICPPIAENAGCTS